MDCRNLALSLLSSAIFAAALLAGCTAKKDGVFVSDDARLRALVKRGSPAIYRRMLRDEDVAVRLEAIEGLLITERAAALPLIRSRMCGRTIVASRAGGLAESTTEGLMVLSLAEQTRIPTTDHGGIFGGEGETDVPLADRDLFRLQVESLSRDDVSGVSTLCRWTRVFFDNHHFRDEHTGEVMLSLPAIRAVCSSMPDLAIIKAVGRGGCSPEAMNLLIACLNDRSLGVESRLAAGSALTRYPEKPAKDAIKAVQPDLDQLPGRPGSELVAISARRHSEEDNEDAVLLGDAAAGAMGPRMLLLLSDRLASFAQPWNTYSHLPFQLEFRLRCGLDNCEFLDESMPFEELSKSELTRLIDNIERAINASSDASDSYVSSLRDEVPRARQRRDRCRQMQQAAEAKRRRATLGLSKGG